MCIVLALFIFGNTCIGCGPKPYEGMAIRSTHEGMSMMADKMHGAGSMDCSNCPNSDCSLCPVVEDSKKPEAFSNMGTSLFAPQFEDAKSNGANTSQWATQSYAGEKGRMVDNDELFFFANTNSSPDCCSYSQYSDSGGCKCLSPEQIQFIQNRGLNGDIASEY